MLFSVRGGAEDERERGRGRKIREVSEWIASRGPAVGPADRMSYGFLFEAGFMSLH